MKVMEVTGKVLWGESCNVHSVKDETEKLEYRDEYLFQR